MTKPIKVIYSVPMSENTRGDRTHIPAQFIDSSFDAESVDSRRLMSLANSHYDMFIMEGITIKAELKAKK